MSIIAIKRKQTARSMNNEAYTYKNMGITYFISIKITLFYDGRDRVRQKCCIDKFAYLITRNFNQSLAKHFP